MNVHLFSHPVSRDDDVVVSRRSAARFAEVLFERAQRAHRVAICVSELARNALNHGGGGSVEFNVSTGSSPMTLVVVCRNEVKKTNADDRSGFQAGLEFVERSADVLEFGDDPAVHEVRAQFELGSNTASNRRRLQDAIALSNEYPATRHLLEQRNQELVAHMETISRREKAARVLLGVVGHDIRNPLAVIQMSIDLALRRTEDDSFKKMLGRARRASTQALQLAADITDFTAEELSTGWEPRPQRFDVVPMTQSLISDFSALHPGRSFHLDADSSQMMNVDPVRFQQALTNLLQNAAKYGSRNGEVRVILLAGGAGEPDRVRVSNPSPPLESRVLDTLFDPFERDDETVGHKPGLGLGLYTVRTIAEKHRGSARATYEDGVFSIELTFAR